MAAGTNLQSYLSTTGKVLYLTPLFAYDITVEIVSKGHYETLYSKRKYSLTPLKLVGSTKYVKRGKSTIQTSIEWIGAPKKFLVEHGFRPIETEEYVDNIKNLRKPKKKNGN